MATPIAHSLFGLACVRLGNTHWRAPAWRWYLFAIVAANAPDLDFIPGLLVGDINRFHQGPTHSLTAALLFGVFATLAARWLQSKPLHVGILGTALYSSHLLLDFFCRDGRPPFGQPLLWPFTDTHWIAPQPLFSGGIKHGVPGDSLVVFIQNVFSWHNLGVMAMEAVILLPLLLISWYLTRNQRQSTG